MHTFLLYLKKKLESLLQAYLTDIRLKKAVELLLEKDENICDCT